MSRELTDSYIHKTVLHRRKNASLKFLTSQSLFSSSVIDVGTNLLLRVIAAHRNKPVESCLDLGCGYGPLGMSLAASGLAKKVEMVDRDALAVDFTRLNATDNGLNAVTAHPSLGFDDVLEEKYDLIVSNLPGKAGSAVLEHLISSAASHLSSGGEFWGVIVNPLWPEIGQFIDGLGASLIHVEQASRHTAFGFRNQQAAVASERTDSLADIYFRDSVDFEVGKRNYTVETSRGVDEFDDLSYTTRLLLERLYEMRRQRRDQAVVFNVSQGYVPIALRASRIVGSLRLVDRDLLALRTTDRNLRLNGLDQPVNFTHHQVGWLPDGVDKGDGVELVVGALRGDEPTQALELGFVSITEKLSSGGVAVIAGGSTPITRMHRLLQARKDVRVLDRSRYRGSSVISFGKPG